MNDLRFAFRQLTKSPGFSAVAILTLSLGIGANTAIFTLVNSILWQHLPYPGAERLVRLERTTPSRQEIDLTPAAFRDWKARSHVFSALTAFGGESFIVTGNGEAEQVWGSPVSADFATLVSVRPILGGGLLPRDFRPGHERVVLLSHSLWQRRFGGDPNVLARPLILNGQSYTIVGVMPKGFYFPARPFDLWLPSAFNAAPGQAQGAFGIGVMARLKNGVSVEQAQREMTAIAQMADHDTNFGVMLTPLLDLVFRDVRPAIFTLMSAAGIVLLIACTNVANLHLARAGRRRKEFAIRRAIGASGWRIVRLVLAESLVLGALGGGLGAILAIWGVDLVVALRPAYQPLLVQTGVSGEVLIFLIAITFLSSLTFGLAPVWQVSRDSLAEDLKQASRTSTARQRGRGLLVSGEIALALVLLVGGGLLLQSFFRLAKVSPGFRADHALTISLALPNSKYHTATQQVKFFRRLLENLSRLPGVKSAGAVSSLPLYGSSATIFQVEGRGIANPAEKPTTYFDAVSPDFFTALGLPLLRGRTFAERDDQSAPPVAIVNETLTRRFFPKEDPIGHRITLGEENDQREIVGVVKDVKSDGLRAEVKPAVYLPYLQNRPAYLAEKSIAMDLVVRTATNPHALAATVRAELQRLDKDVPITKLETLERLLNESIAQERFNAILLATFAGLAVFLAALGIYGLINYTVGQRVPEIGLRMALGAQRGDIVDLVVRGTMLVVAIGIAAGLLGSMLLSRFLSSLLFHVKALDAGTYFAVVIVLLLAALAACYFPARRAARVDPVDALRSE